MKETPHKDCERMNYLSFREMLYYLNDLTVKINCLQASTYQMTVLLQLNSNDLLLFYMLHELTIFRHPHMYIKWLCCCSLTVSADCYLYVTFVDYFQASTYQMAVLLQFNSVGRLLFYMLHELTIFRHPHIRWLYCCSLTVSTDWPFNRWKRVRSSSR